MSFIRDLSLVQDLRFALRTIRKRPAASAVVVLTLALGIGANATFFAAYYGVVLRPLPFESPDRLVGLFESRPDLGETWDAVSAANLRDWRADNPVLAGAGAYRWANYNFQSAEDPEPVLGAEVSADLFPLLGVEPAFGRNFSAPEDTPGGPLAVLISHDLWSERFAADPAVVGRTLRLDDELREIVGVMPAGFQFPLVGDVWTPLQSDPAAERRDRRSLSVIGRLRENVTVKQAQAAMDAVAGRLAALHPETNAGRGVHVRRLHDAWLPPVTQLASAAQLVLVGGVLLIVCANVTNIVLAQAASRKQESALRAVLGASRPRLIRQSLVESTVLALGGGGLGLLLASWSEVWIENLSAVPIPYWLSFAVEGRVVAYTLVVTLATGILIGLAPALKSSGRHLFEALKSGGRLEDTSTGWLRKGLVAAEYALALVILVAGLLMAKSFANLRQADSGFDTERVLTLRLPLTGRSFDDPAVRSVYLDEALRRLDGLAETAGVGAVSRLPISQYGHLTTPLGAEGRSFPEGDEPRVTLQTVSDGFHAAAGIPLLAGRAFTRAETRDGAGVAILSQSLAELLWPGQDPLGRRIRALREDPGLWLEVVGVAGDVEPGRMIAGLDMFPGYQVYAPMAGAVIGISGFDNPPRIPSVVIRGRAEPSALAAAVRRELREVNRSVPIFEVLTMDEVLRKFYFAQHIWGRMFSAIALLALVIALVGAYGVTAYSVSRRTREMGVRIAMGASPGRLLVLVVRQGLAVAAAGVVLGLAGAVSLARMMQSLLHDMRAIDTGVFTSVAAILLAVGFVASYVPARRAAAVDPIVVLRDE